MKNTQETFTDLQLSEDYNYGSYSQPKTKEQSAEILKGLLQIEIPDDAMIESKISVEELVYSVAM